MWAEDNVIKTDDASCEAIIRRIEALPDMADDIDGTFDDEDIRIFGETMAHEVNHYLGLFHPVEVDFARWDALGDTPNCSDESNCHEVLAENLMFPYPICSLTSCLPQETLTEQQKGVLHRYVGVR